MKKTGTFFVIFLLFFSLLPNYQIQAARVGITPIKIVIDPGHGGRDPGAIGVNGLYEKEVNLDISLRLRDLLVAEGYEVIMTREADHLLVDYIGSSEKYLDLQARVDVATRERADLFVSIHANSFRSTSQGTMVLYYDPIKKDPAYVASPYMELWSSESKKLATSIVDSITYRVGTKNLGPVPSNVYVVRSGTVPSVLVETAFLSNVEEAAMLSDSNFRQAVAEAIRDGILDYQPVRFVDIIQHWAKKEILALSFRGIVHGYQDHHFRPQQELTRAELVTLLDKAYGFKGFPLVDEAFDHRETITDFIDLPREHWAYHSMVTAYQSGIIKGYQDGSLRPDRKVSREEMAEILYRLSFLINSMESVPVKIDTVEIVDQVEVEIEIEDGKQEEPEFDENGNQNEAELHEDVEEGVDHPKVEENQIVEDVQEEQLTPEENENTIETPLLEEKKPMVVTSAFIDVPEAHWSEEAITTLRELGIIKGFEGNRFGFGQSVTRAEAATLLYRLLEENLVVAFR